MAETTIGTKQIRNNSLKAEDLETEFINNLTEKTSVTDADILLLEDSANSYSKKKLQTKNLLIFGSQYNYGESEGESSTTSTSYQQKLRLTTGVVPAGDYKISWYAEVSQNAEESPFKMRVQIDDTTTIGAVRDTNLFSKSEGDYQSFSGIKKATLSNAIHNIDIDYSSTGEGGTVYIRKARIELFRIS